MSNNQESNIREIKKEEIVFESANGANTIIDDKKNNLYLLLHSNGKCACFDHIEKILKAVMRAVENGGNFQISNSNKVGFYIADNRGKFRYGLNQLIISTAYKKKLSDIKKGRIIHSDNNILNCCLDNLDCTKITNAVSSPYTVMHDEKYIYLKHNNGQKAILTYYPELYKIVRNRRWDYQKGINAFYTVITKNHSKEIIQLTLHQLTYIFYHYQGVTHRNILSNIRAYKANFAKYNLEVDHLNSDRMNDCEYNISAMDKSLNISKSNITVKIIAPFFHYAVYVNDTYKVVVGVYNYALEGNEQIKMQAYQCDTAEAYVALLKQFFNEGVLPNGERLSVSPKKWYLKCPEKERQPIDQALPLDKENLIDRLLKADTLPLYVSENDKRAA